VRNRLSRPAPSWRRSAGLAALTLLATLPAGAAFAQDAFTLYELLEPSSHRFAITYDVTTAREGATHFLNPVRPGSKVYDERVIDLASGKDLHFTLMTGAEAKAAGLARDRTPDADLFLAVNLPHPVPAGGEVRLRIIKTYEDPASYTTEGDTIVFDRGLGIRANSVVLPAGYELIGSATPGMVSTLSDGRIKISFLNDRDDTLPVRVVGRRLPGGAR